MALVRPDTGDETLQQFHDAGVRGARLNFTPRLGPAPSDATVRGVVARIRPLGWHLSLLGSGADLERIAALVPTLGVPVVIDHMGRVDLSAGWDSPPVRALLRLLDSGDAWVKLSGADRLATRPPDLGHAAAFAAMLASRAPHRVLWGTDFPHPNVDRFMPNDGDLVDLLSTIAPDPALRHRILVTNPAECFGFDLQD